MLTGAASEGEYYRKMEMQRVKRLARVQRFAAALVSSCVRACMLHVCACLQATYCFVDRFGCCGWLRALVTDRWVVMVPPTKAVGSAPISIAAFCCCHCRRRCVGVGRRCVGVGRRCVGVGQRCVAVGCRPMMPSIAVRAGDGAQLCGQIKKGRTYAS